MDVGVLAELRESVGGDPDFVAELIGEFLEDAPAQLDVLRGAVAANDAESAMRAAHTLKGNARTFGAMKLASVCQELESLSKDGELLAVAARLDGVDAAWAQAQTHLASALGATG